jgi:hypothetical protein
MSLRLRGAIARTELHVRSDRVRIDDLVGIHPAVRIPDRLELPEGPHQLGAVHLLQELPARLPVAVLAGKGTTVLQDQVGRLVQERAPLADAAG